MNDACNNKNCILTSKKEDEVSDLSSPGTSTNESSAHIHESKRMKGVRVNIKEKSISSKSARMKKRKEMSMNSKYANDDTLKSKNINST